MGFPLFACVICLLTLTGCQNNPPSERPAPDTGRKAPTISTGTPAPTASGFPVTLTDARGKTLTLNAPPQRIVSLAPSNTEILYALGAGDRIAGVTTSDDYPPEVKQKHSIGGYPFSLEKIEATNPDLILPQGRIAGKEVEALEKVHLPVLMVDAKNIAETYESIILLGKAVGKEKEAEQVVQEMEKRFLGVRNALAKGAARPKVLILYGVKPIYTTGPGSFIDDVITIAGGKNIVDKPLPRNEISPEKVIDLAPDVIICAPDLQEQVKQIPGWASSVPAVKNNRFYSAANSSPLVRPGPRLGEAAEALAHYLHPEAFAGSGKP